MNDFKMRELHESLCDLVTYFKSHTSGKLDAVDTEEVGNIADIIKDLAAAEKYCYEACYYKTVIDAMEEKSKPSYSYGYRPMVDQEPYVNRYLDRNPMMSNSGRYNMGYIDPKDMSNAMDNVKSMWMSADPERRKSLKLELASMINDMD